MDNRQAWGYIEFMAPKISSSRLAWVVSWLFFCSFFLALAPPLPAAEPPKYTTDAKITGAVESPYTPFIIKMIKTWPAENPADLASDKNLVQLQCFETQGNDLYIGAEQIMTIHAPLSRVEAVLDDFKGYPALFDGLLKVEVKEQDGNRFLTYWEQSIPIPLVPNVKNHMFYVIDKPDPRKKIYRYQLKQSNHLKFNDGFILLEEKGPNLTHYVEFDFWDADWGIAKTFGKDRIWRDNIEGLYQSDLAIKLKAESPDSKEDFLEKSKELLGKMPTEDKIHHKIPLKP